MRKLMLLQYLPLPEQHVSFYFIFEKKISERVQQKTPTRTTALPPTKHFPTKLLTKNQAVQCLLAEVDSFRDRVVVSLIIYSL